MTVLEKVLKDAINNPNSKAFTRMLELFQMNYIYTLVTLGLK